MKFDFNEIANFDDHIRMSIPNYDQLFSQVVETIDCLDSRGGLILDLGCSTGRLINSLSSESIKIGIDNSDLCPVGAGFIQEDVLEWEFPECTTIVSLFFLQFLTRQERVTVMKKIKDSLESGGYFYCAEKIHYDDPILDSVTKEAHIQHKRGNFTDSDILDKSAKLSRSMWLSTDSQLRDELSEIGEPIEIWRSYTFCCYVVKKS